MRPRRPPTSSRSGGEQRRPRAVTFLDLREGDSPPARSNSSCTHPRAQRPIQSARPVHAPASPYPVCQNALAVVVVHRRGPREPGDARPRALPPLDISILAGMRRSANDRMEEQQLRSTGAGCWCSSSATRCVFALPSPCLPASACFLAALPFRFASHRPPRPLWPLSRPRARRPNPRPNAHMLTPWW